MRLDSRLQSIEWRCIVWEGCEGGRHVPQHDTHTFVEHLLDDVVLRGKVMVYAARLDADPVGNRPRRGGLIPPMAQQPGSGVENIPRSSTGTNRFVSFRCYLVSLGI